MIGFADLQIVEKEYGSSALIRGWGTVKRQGIEQFP